MSEMHKLRIYSCQRISNEKIRKEMLPDENACILELEWIRLAMRTSGKRDFHIAIEQLEDVDTPIQYENCVISSKPIVNSRNSRSQSYKKCVPWAYKVGDLSPILERAEDISTLHFGSLTVRYGLDAASDPFVSITHSTHQDFVLRLSGTERGPWPNRGWDNIPRGLISETDLASTGDPGLDALLNDIDFHRFHKPSRSSEAQKNKSPSHSAVLR